ncbi:hypothetical protein QJQ45_019992 [Haematococcus lacustris]|nr:hypothetical protein QJQ45_019992 [Haematococcus lacustris]
MAFAASSFDATSTTHTIMSAPGTPTGATSLNPGALIYAEFMDTYHRRLRKPAPVKEAGQRFHGRTTPLKGKGMQPEDCQETSPRPSKRSVPGRSYAAVLGLLAHPEKLSLSMDASPLRVAMAHAYHDSSAPSAGQRPASASGERPCLRMTPMSHKSCMAGAGLTHVVEPVTHRPLRKAGPRSPLAVTKSRTLLVEDGDAPLSPLSSCKSPMLSNVLGGGAVWGEADAMSPQSPRQLASRASQLAALWQRQVQTASGELPSGPLDLTLSPRPATAPRMTEARRRYHEGGVANLDLFQYRHSAGICPDAYQFDASRAAAPHLTSPRADSAKDSYDAAHNAYAMNRVRSLLSSGAYA